MAEITIKGKSLIKKIDKTDTEYNTYIPLDGELVCVTDGNSSGLVVGDGTSTVENCKSVGGSGGDSFTPVTITIDAINDNEQISIEVTGIPDDPSTIAGRNAYITDTAFEAYTNSELAEFSIFPCVQYVRVNGTTLSIGLIGRNTTAGSDTVNAGELRFSTYIAEGNLGEEEFTWGGASVEEFTPRTLFTIIIY